MTKREPPNLRDPDRCANCRHRVWDGEVKSMCCSKYIVKLTDSFATVCDDYEEESDDKPE